MKGIVYIHYGSTVFDSSKSFPIRNGANHVEVFGLLAKTRLLVGKRGVNKRNLETAMSIILLNFDCVIMQK